MVGALDILTDTALIALPTYIIWKLQMARSSKFMISIAFACRFVYDLNQQPCAYPGLIWCHSLFPVVVLRLVFLSSALSSLDKTFDYRKTVFTMIADANASVVIACIPFLKPFMKGLDSGLLTSDLRVRGPKSSLFPYISSSKGSGQGSKNNNNYALNKVSAQATLDRGLGRLHTDRIQNKVNISHDPPQHDFESRTSAGSDKMIIKRTVGWDVNFDGAEETHLAV